METKVFTKASLLAFIESAEFAELENVPISRSRAYSQIANPRAEENDVLLVASFDGKKTAGYLGVLPDHFVANEEIHRFGWLTCFWVGDEYKDKNIAASLFLRVIRAWQKNICITNIVPWLEPVYQKTKIFQPTAFKTGRRFYLRSNISELLPPKHAFFEKSKPLLKAGDSLANIFISTLIPLKRTMRKHISIEYLASFDSVPEQLLLQDGDSLPKRRKEELNWLISKPWVLGGLADTDSERYYFTSLENRFVQRVVQFTDNISGDLACVVYNIRNNHLTVPYVFGEGDLLSCCADFIYAVAGNYHIDMITVFEPRLVEQLSKNKPAFALSKEVKKPYFIAKTLDFVNGLNFQDGDGDCGFY